MIVKKHVLWSPIVCVYSINCVYMLKLGDGKVVCDDVCFMSNQLSCCCVCVFVCVVRLCVFVCVVRLCVMVKCGG